MKREAILFDLDGTLLPMRQERFISLYFSELTDKLVPFGYEKQNLIESIWQGTHAMVKNDGSATNEVRFWDKFSELVGSGIVELKDEFEDFYTNEFNRAKIETSENALARKALALAREKAGQLVLATNPLFPLCAVETRLSWVGLKASDFDYITTYENSSYCKPNPNYYYEIMRKIKADPINCLMIGNDADEDAAASGKAGIQCYLVTDCLLSGMTGLESIQNGTFSQMLEFLSSI